MTGKRWSLIALAVVVVAVLIWLWVRNGEPQVAVDLVQQFPSAEKRSSPMPVDEAVKVVSETINGETKPAILACPATRIIWRVRPPADAWLSTYLAIRADAWDKESDGVLFMIGISDGRIYDQVLEQHVDPRNVPGDRRWVPVTVDLSPYADREVDLIFNTRSSRPKAGDHPENDFALWGAPRIALGR
jgi:hypothetical protein